MIHFCLTLRLVIFHTAAVSGTPIHNDTISLSDSHYSQTLQLETTHISDHTGLNPKIAVAMGVKDVCHFSARKHALKIQDEDLYPTEALQERVVDKSCNKIKTAVSGTVTLGTALLLSVPTAGTALLVLGGAAYNARGHYNAT